MIEPQRSGSDLLQEIDSTQPAAGELAIWWLGQSGYALKTASTLLYIDLYLSEHLTKKYADTPKPHNRMTHAPLRGYEITQAGLVFASHKHSDHLDPETIPELFAASPQAQLVLPMALADHAVSLGIPRERLLPTHGDEVFTHGGVTIHSFPSAHPDLDYDDASGYPFLGFGLEVDGLRLYHSGDTVVYDGLAARLRAFRPQLVFLPINGRAGGAGTPPNMDAAEAVALAQSIGNPLVIPHHYDMFTFNTADVDSFVALAAAAGVRHQVLQPGGFFCWRAV
jgi:L-ascorbate metabolism protein UlaG (beta-lactamase superfamily)